MSLALERALAPAGGGLLAAAEMETGDRSSPYLA
jgi:hypothetical protein